MTAPGRALCAQRRRRRRSTSLAFMHSNLPMSPSLPVWADDAMGSPDAVPIELASVGARVQFVLQTTAFQLVQGGALGGLFGFLSGAFSKRSLGIALSEARTNARSWGGISATYAGLQAASYAIRKKEDRVNSIVGACGSGAVFSANGGPRAALQGCVSFAAISFLIEAMLMPKEEQMVEETDPAVILKK